MAKGDDVDTTAEGCKKAGCNVVLGSMNAAMVVENCFWLWFENSAFAFYGEDGHCPNGPGRESSDRDLCSSLCLPDVTFCRAPV